MNLAGKVTTFQQNVWYIEYLNLWCTTDSSKSFSAWDIQTENRVYKINKLNSNIVSLAELPHIKKVAFAMGDRTL